MSPVGRWMTCTALSVFCSACPPLPEARQVDQSRSDGRMQSSVSDGIGRTATVIVLECTRPRFSVGGTRCQR